MALKYWHNGGMFGGVSGTNSTAGTKYWHNGAPYLEFINGTTIPIKSVGGVLWNNIKKIGGVVIANIKKIMTKSTS